MNHKVKFFRDRWPLLFLLILLLALAFFQFSAESERSADVVDKVSLPLSLSGPEMRAEKPAAALTLTPSPVSRPPRGEQVQARTENVIETAPLPTTAVRNGLRLAGALPALDASDSAFRQSLADASKKMGFSPLQKLLLRKDLLPRFVVMGEQIKARRLPRRHFPVIAPAGHFKVQRQADGLLTIDDDNFRRYLPYVEALEAFDPERLAMVYHRFMPLFGQAFRDIGHRQGRPLQRLMTAIDILLATPDVDNPELKRYSVSYRYADAKLEALPEVQRLLIRTGPDNMTRVKQWLRRFRRALVKEIDE